jgi:transcriptional regulator with XRE-family HTH domain
MARATTSYAAGGNADPIDVAVGARIRLRRQQLGLSQTQLADALQITFQQVQKYERATNRVSASRLVRTAVALDISVAELVGESDAEPVFPIVAAQLATQSAHKLLAAFAAIEDGEVRRAVLAVAQRVALEDERRGQAEPEGTTTKPKRTGQVSASRAQKAWERRRRGGR